VYFQRGLPNSNGGSVLIGNTHYGTMTEGGLTAAPIAGPATGGI